MELGGGVRLRLDESWGWLCLDEQRPQFRIVAESVNAEQARQLYDFCEWELRKMAGQIRKIAAMP